MKLLEALRVAGRKIVVDFEESKLISHSGEKGQFREFVLSNLLRPYLPECYGLGTGEVFSSDGSVSKQIDIVIYDNIYSNVLLKNKSTSLFPCESIYGQIEVKSKLNKEELIKSIDNIKSVKSLKRENSSGLDINPLVNISLGRGLFADNTKRNPYLGVIFAYDSTNPESLREELNNRINEANKFELPNFIFCLKRQYMILRANNDKSVELDGEFNRFALVKTGEDTIPLMFLAINACLSFISLKSINYVDYWTFMLEKIADGQQT